MKIMTILGTRPEIIRLSKVIPKLDDVVNHVLVHTGQNYDHSLNEVFFNELNIRVPDYFLNIKGSFCEQMGQLFPSLESVIKKEHPDKILILGDTNSALSAIVAKKFSIPVYHMEAGNRCFDDRVPEEVNRRIIDHCSDILIPYTNNSKQNLINEGIDLKQIFVSGNPILEVIRSYESKIVSSIILDSLKILPKQYFLVTLHRSENVDVEERLNNFSDAFKQINRTYNLPVIVSTHPHTQKCIEGIAKLDKKADVRYLPPFGMFDFVKLERNAKAVLSDSGTVQEECCIYKIPNVTLRDVTERPETIECGSNILSGANPEQILLCLDLVLSHEPNWEAPEEYLRLNVSNVIVNLLLGHV
jgi:UDP-N-acetylglucosamine 2-epimerase (non-hydrolysing)